MAEYRSSSPPYDNDVEPEGSFGGSLAVENLSDGSVDTHTAPSTPPTRKAAQDPRSMSYPGGYPMGRYGDEDQRSDDDSDDEVQGGRGADYRQSSGIGRPSASSGGKPYKLSLSMTAVADTSRGDEDGDDYDSNGGWASSPTATAAVARWAQLSPRSQAKGGGRGRRDPGDPGHAGSLGDGQSTCDSGAEAPSERKYSADASEGEVGGVPTHPLSMLQGPHTAAADHAYGGRVVDVGGRDRRLNWSVEPMSLHFDNVREQSAASLSVRVSNRARFKQSFTLETLPHGGLFTLDWSPGTAPSGAPPGGATELTIRLPSRSRVDLVVAIHPSRVPPSPSNPAGGSYANGGGGGRGRSPPGRGRASRHVVAGLLRVTCRPHEDGSGQDGGAPSLGPPTTVDVPLQAVVVNQPDADGRSGGWVSASTGPPSPVPDLPSDNPFTAGGSSSQQQQQRRSGESNANGGSNNGSSGGRSRGPSGAGGGGNSIPGLHTAGASRGVRNRVVSPVGAQGTPRPPTPPTRGKHVGRNKRVGWGGSDNVPLPPPGMRTPPTRGKRSVRTQWEDQLDATRAAVGMSPQTARWAGFGPMRAGSSLVSPPSSALGGGPTSLEDMWPSLNCSPAIVAWGSISTRVPPMVPGGGGCAHVRHVVVRNAGVAPCLLWANIMLPTARCARAYDESCARQLAATVRQHNGMLAASESPDAALAEESVEGGLFLDALERVAQPGEFRLLGWRSSGIGVYTPDDGIEPDLFLEGCTAPAWSQGLLGLGAASQEGADLPPAEEGFEVAIPPCGAVVLALAFRPQPGSRGVARGTLRLLARNLEWAQDGSAVPVRAEPNGAVLSTESVVPLVGHCGAGAVVLLDGVADDGSGSIALPCPPEQGLGAPVSVRVANVGERCAFVRAVCEPRPPTSALGLDSPGYALASEAARCVEVEPSGLVLDPACVGELRLFLRNLPKGVQWTHALLASVQLVLYTGDELCRQKRNQSRALWRHVAHRGDATGPSADWWEKDVFEEDDESTAVRQLARQSQQQEQGDGDAGRAGSDAQGVAGVRCGGMFSHPPSATCYARIVAASLDIPLEEPEVVGYRGSADGEDSAIERAHEVGESWALCEEAAAEEAFHNQLRPVMLKLTLDDGRHRGGQQSRRTSGVLDLDPRLTSPVYTPPFGTPLNSPHPVGVSAPVYATARGGAWSHAGQSGDSAWTPPMGYQPPTAFRFTSSGAGQVDPSDPSAAPSNLTTDATNTPIPSPVPSATPQYTPRSDVPSDLTDAAWGLDRGVPATVGASNASGAGVGTSGAAPPPPASSSASLLQGRSPELLAFAARTSQAASYVRSWTSDMMRSSGWGPKGRGRGRGRGRGADDDDASSLEHGYEAPEVVESDEDDRDGGEDREEGDRATPTSRPRELLSADYERSPSYYRRQLAHSVPDLRRHLREGESGEEASPLGRLSRSELRGSARLREVNRLAGTLSEDAQMVYPQSPGRWARVVGRVDTGLGRLGRAAPRESLGTATATTNMGDWGGASTSAGARAATYGDGRFGTVAWRAIGTGQGGGGVYEPVGGAAPGARPAPAEGGGYRVIARGGRSYSPRGVPSPVGRAAVTGSSGGGARAQASGGSASGQQRRRSPLSASWSGTRDGGQNGHGDALGSSERRELAASSPARFYSPSGGGGDSPGRYALRSGQLLLTRSAATGWDGAASYSPRSRGAGTEGFRGVMLRAAWEGGGGSPSGASGGASPAVGYKRGVRPPSRMYAGAGVRQLSDEEGEGEGEEYEDEGEEGSYQAVHDSEGDDEGGEDDEGDGGEGEDWYDGEEGEEMEEGGGHSEGEEGHGKEEGERSDEAEEGSDPEQGEGEGGAGGDVASSDGVLSPRPLSPTPPRGIDDDDGWGTDGGEGSPRARYGASTAPPYKYNRSSSSPAKNGEAEQGRAGEGAAVTSGGRSPSSREAQLAAINDSFGAVSPDPSHLDVMVHSLRAAEAAEEAPPMASLPPRSKGGEVPMQDLRLSLGSHPRQLLARGNNGRDGTSRGAGSTASGPTVGQGWGASAGPTGIAPVATHRRHGRTASWDDSKQHARQYQSMGASAGSSSSSSARDARPAPGRDTRGGGGPGGRRKGHVAREPSLRANQEVLEYRGGDSPQASGAQGAALDNSSGSFGLGFGHADGSSSPQVHSPVMGGSGGGSARSGQGASPHPQQQRGGSDAASGVGAADGSGGGRRHMTHRSATTGTTSASSTTSGGGDNAGASNNNSNGNNASRGKLVAVKPPTVMILRRGGATRGAKPAASTSLAVDLGTFVVYNRSPSERVFFTLRPSSDVLSVRPTEGVLAPGTDTRVIVEWLGGGLDSPPPGKGAGRAGVDAAGAGGSSRKWRHGIVYLQANASSGSDFTAIDVVAGNMD
eukprot:jgi/Mesvir1/27649/Mv07377-RA.1